MPNLYDQGIITPYDSLGVIPVEVYSAAINFFVNRTPLYSRFPHLPVGSLSFKINNTKYRPSTVTFGAAVTDTTGTSFTLNDASYLMVGDVIEVDNEMVQVTADPNTATNVVTVARGVAGTTGATHLVTATGYLLGNARTGGEINQSAINQVPNPLVQNLQTFQHPVQVGGAMESAFDYALPPGVESLIGKERMKAMQEVADDYERSAYYGKPAALSATVTRPMQTGLRTLLTTNNTASPTNASAYKPSDLIRDTIQPCFANGGNPDTFLVSTDFMTGLSIWGQAVQRVPAGENAFGTPIDLFEAPFLSGVTIIPAPLLRTGTVICLTSGEIRNRVKRPMFDKPRGSRGDATESDVIAEMAIESENEHHHAIVSGITGFSAT
jgi:hypothetical protein